MIWIFLVLSLSLALSLSRSLSLPLYFTLTFSIFPNCSYDLKLSTLFPSFKIEIKNKIGSRKNELTHDALVFPLTNISFMHLYHFACASFVGYYYCNHKHQSPHIKWDSPHNLAIDKMWVVFKCLIKFLDRRRSTLCSCTSYQHNDEKGIFHFIISKQKYFKYIKHLFC